MNYSAIRPYEMSVWTLRDTYIASLRAAGVENKGQIEDAHMRLNTDGTQELEFNVPMYIHQIEYKDNEPSISYNIENPRWYDVKNGLLMVGLRKIKVVFNKNTKDEEIYEFLITEVNEEHGEDDSLYCRVKGTGLAFQELGKKGYKRSLTADEYYLDYNNYWDADPDERANMEEPINNIDYWCKKVFDGTDWSYSIQMDWEFYDGCVLRRFEDSQGQGIAIMNFPSDNRYAEGAIVGLARTDYSKTSSSDAIIFDNHLIAYYELTPEEQKTVNSTRENAGLRRNDKVYEDDYIASWNVDTNDMSLVPKEYVSIKEKNRLIECTESNMYNASQAIAEAFGVFCRYKYHYDDNCHIIKKEVIFYNDFMDEFNGTIDLTYNYNVDSMTRTMDSNDVYTKLLVKSVNDNTSATGILSIMNTDANKSLEDYVLNFDYLYQTHAIEEDQYKAVPVFEYNMRLKNQQLINLSEQIIALQNKINQYEADMAVASNSVAMAQKRVEDAYAGIRALTKNETGVIESPPRLAILLKDESNHPYVKLTAKGVQTDTVEAYRECKGGTTKNSDLIPKSGYSFKTDDVGNVSKLIFTNLSLDDIDSLRRVYLRYNYEPQLYYINIINTFNLRAQLSQTELEQKEALRDQSKLELENISNQYDELLAEKQAIVQDFENMMGPAIREGTWQPDSYNNYGDKHDVVINDSDDENLFWDEEPFEGENLLYTSVGVNQTPQYYHYIDLIDDDVNRLNIFKDNISTDIISHPLQFRYRTVNSPDAPFVYKVLGADAYIGFIKDDETVKPVLVIKDMPDKYYDPALCVIDMSVDPPINVNSMDGFHLLVNNMVANTIKANTPSSSAFHKADASTKLVYPRFKFNSLSIRNTEDELKVFIGDNKIRNYYDYNILSRDDSYYLTFKNEAFVATNFWSADDEDYNKIHISYVVSNAELNIYLDALEIMRTNAYPQASYSVKVITLNNTFIRVAYKHLSRMVHINDYELKLKNTLGYIAELDLDLDRPWEDTVEIKNYRTKFEDLFTKIVTSSEQMRVNGTFYNIAAGAFDINGALRGDVLFNSLEDNIFSLGLVGGLKLDKKLGLYTENENGVLAFNNQGIFSSQEKDALGNWINWEPIILPTGINANSLTSGTINTNLIRIFSGDELRLQMNESGLYAYKTLYNNNESDLPDTFQYVVHNADGLFLKADKGTLHEEKTISFRAVDKSEDISFNWPYYDGLNFRINSSSQTLSQDVERVAISWDGLKLSNWKGENTFYADPDTGNLIIAGTLLEKDSYITVPEQVVKEINQYINNSKQYTALSELAQQIITVLNNEKNFSDENKTVKFLLPNTVIIRVNKLVDVKTDIARTNAEINAQTNAQAILDAALTNIGLKGTNVQAVINTKLETFTNTFNNMRTTIENAIAALPKITAGTTQPSDNNHNGDLFYDQSTNTQYIYDTNQWVEVYRFPKHTSGSGEPSSSNAAAGDTYYDTTTGISYVYDGSDWVATSSGNSANSAENLIGTGININGKSGAINIRAGNNISLLSGQQLNFITVNTNNVRQKNLFQLDNDGIQLLTVKTLSAVGAQVYVGTTGTYSNPEGSNYIYMSDGENGKLRIYTTGQMNIGSNGTLTIASQGNLTVASGGSLTIGASSGNAATLSLLSTGKLYAFGSNEVVIATAQSSANILRGSYIWMHNSRIDIGANEMQILNSGKFSAVSSDEVVIASTYNTTDGASGNYIWMHKVNLEPQLDIGTTGNLTMSSTGKMALKAGTCQLSAKETTNSYIALGVDTDNVDDTDNLAAATVLLDKDGIAAPAGRFQTLEVNGSSIIPDGLSNKKIVVQENQPTGEDNHDIIWIRPITTNTSTTTEETNVYQMTNTFSQNQYGYNTTNPSTGLKPYALTNYHTLNAFTLTSGNGYFNQEFSNYTYTVKIKVLGWQTKSDQTSKLTITGGTVSLTGNNNTVELSKTGSAITIGHGSFATVTFKATSDKNVLGIGSAQKKPSIAGTNIKVKFTGLWGSTHDRYDLALARYEVYSLTCVGTQTESTPTNGPYTCEVKYIP